MLVDGFQTADCFELFSRRCSRVEGNTALSLAHHVNHFDAAKRGSRSGKRLEAEHRAYSPRDAAMILLDPIVVYWLWRMRIGFNGRRD
ncbi:hypothetical protein X748_27640 [Mesorhizobium sp. LNJC386A00]|nr:hypothetical protein X748_27640 [Mesorhizobium sp. LNJC386A00]